MGYPIVHAYFFLCEETKHLRDLIKNKDVPQIVRAEITDDELRKVHCSADRSGFLIYQGNNRLEL